jgi:hypothetical protein
MRRPGGIHPPRGPERFIEVVRGDDPKIAADMRRCQPRKDEANAKRSTSW